MENTNIEHVQYALLFGILATSSEFIYNVHSYIYIEMDWELGSVDRLQIDLMEINLLGNSFQSRNNHDKVNLKICMFKQGFKRRNCRKFLI